jgi:hypothetical protein
VAAAQFEAGRFVREVAHEAQVVFGRDEQELNAKTAARTGRYSRQSFFER